MEKHIIKLIEDHLDLPCIIATKRMCGFDYRDYTHDDAVASGMYGLFQAAKSYKFNNGTQFRTFASVRVNGQILDDMRSFNMINNRNVHNPLSVCSLDVEINTNGEHLTHKDQLVCDKDSPHKISEQKNFAKALEDCLRILTKKEQEIMSLLYFEGLYQDEVADIIGLSGGRISQIHSRVLNKLKRCKRMKELRRSYYDN